VAGRGQERLARVPQLAADGVRVHTGAGKAAQAERAAQGHARETPSLLTKGLGVVAETVDTHRAAKSGAGHNTPERKAGRVPAREPDLLLCLARRRGRPGRGGGKSRLRLPLALQCFVRLLLALGVPDDPCQLFRVPLPAELSEKLRLQQALLEMVTNGLRANARRFGGSCRRP